MNINKVIRELDKRKKALASERDKLRDFISELDMLKGNCDEAIDNIERAVDALSELV